MGWLGSLLALLLFALPAQAQFLRVGPFDFTGQVKAGLIWSDNVDELRPSEREKSPSDDFSVLSGFAMNSDTPFGRRGNITLGGGFEVEDFIHRNDLDEVRYFGLFRAETVWEGRLLTLRPYYSIEQTIDSEVDQYIPGGNGIILNPSVLEEYGVAALWTRDPFSAGAEFISSRERYLKDRFKFGDQDTLEVNFFARWQVTEKAGLEYRNENTQEKLVNDPAADDDWETTESILVDWELALWRRPKVVFTFGVEKEDTETEQGTWDPIYNINISDAYLLGSRLKLDFIIDYNYETDPEVDDIVGLTFDTSLEHELGRNAQQRLFARREPRDTLGANEDTDTTTYGYSLKLSDMFVRGLNFLGTYDYEINRPPKSPREDIETIELMLSHVVLITPRLNRSFNYTYTREKSNLENELLLENRVEWIYTYEL